MPATLPPALRAARSARSSLAAAIAVSLALAAVTGVGLAAASAVTSALDLRDAAVLAGYLAGLYGLVNLAGNGSLALALLALGLRPGIRVFLAASAAFYVLLNGALRFILVTQLLSVTPFTTVVGIAEAVALLTVALLVLGALLASSAGKALRRGTAAALLLGALWGFQVWHEHPHERDLARLLPPLLENAAEARDTPPAEASGGFADAELVVLGFDGITWEILLPLLRRGDLPSFAAFLDDAAYGSLGTLSFAVSPVVWETMATGQPPARHGIGYHGHFEFPGMRERLRAMPSYTLCNTPMGLRRLLTFADRWAPWSLLPADSTDARVARFWEIVSRSGRTVGVYNWLNTGPVVPVNGFLHAYGTTEPLDYPPDLNEGLPPLVEVPWSSEPGIIERFEPHEQAHYERFVALAERHAPDVLMYYTHFADAAHHLHWKSDLIGDRLVYGGLTNPDFEPGPSITLAYRHLDQILGDVLARASEQATIAIVSDHGFGFLGYEHDNGPPGVVMVRGPGVRPGLVEGADVYDVTPTLLHVLRLPVADDMKGGVLPIARAGGPLDRQPARVASHGASASRSAHATGSDPEALERQKEYLRALGYVY